MNVLIADDEELSLLELEYILSNIEYISDISKASNGFEVLKLCEVKKFDVTFLDIKLGDYNGIRIAQQLLEKEKPPKIVFVTAFEEYAVKAFELQAVDYVLKPFSEERIKKTLDRLENILKDKDQIEESIKQDVKSLNKLAVEQDGRISLIDIDDIIFIEADGRNSTIRTSSGKYHTKVSLKDLERRLGGLTFFRPHRSFIINLKKIKEVAPWFNGTYIIKMEGYEKTDITVTRKNTGRFRKFLNL